MPFEARTSFLTRPGLVLPQATRRWVLALLAGSCLLALSPAVGAAETLAAPSAPPADRWQRVKVVLDIKGELKLNADGRKTMRAPLEVTSQQNYLERLPAKDSAYESLVSLRHYQQAEAKFQVGRSKFESRLEESHELVGQMASDGQLELFSPHGPLSRDELDLIDIPCNSAVVQKLLPTKPVAAGGTWTVPDLVWAQLLGLETIQQNTIQLKLDRWEGSAAMIQAEGAVQGSVGGVSTDIDLKAKMQFDRKLGQFTWVAIGMTEDRAIGHAEPGYRAGLRIRMALEPVRDGGPLADRAIADLPWDPESANALIVLPAPAAGLRLLVDRRWRMMTHRPDSVILRLVDHGDLVAQCNMSPLPPLPAGRQLTLDELQDDIRQSLGDNFRQFAEATQSVDEGRRVLRVVAVGEASDLPIQWIYYHVSDDQGRRFSSVFSIEAELVERFGDADRALISSTEFVAVEPLPSRDPEAAPPDEQSETTEKTARNTPAEATPPAK